MEVTFDIQMRGTAEEVEQWLGRLGAPAVVPGTAGADAGVSGPVLTDDQADRLISRITDDARKALRYIAEHEPEVSWEAVQEHLGIGGIQIGGVMASFGFAENAGIPRPYRKDRSQRTYSIDPATAEVVLSAIDRYENRHGQAA